LVCRCLLVNENSPQSQIFDFGLFEPFVAKTAKIEQKLKKKWQNPNRLIKFSEIWYVDSFQQKKMLQKNCFSILAFFGLFWPKNSKD